MHFGVNDFSSVVSEILQQRMRPHSGNTVKFHKLQSREIQHMSTSVKLQTAQCTADQSTSLECRHCTVQCTADQGCWDDTACGFLFHYRWPVSWGDLSLNSESNRQLKLGSIGGGGDRTSPAFCSQAFGSENPVVLREKKKEIPCCFRAKCRGENQKGVLWDPIGTVDLKFQN